MYNFLSNTSLYKKIMSHLKDNNSGISLCNMTDAAKVHFVSTFSQYKKIVITRDETKARKFISDLKFYFDDNERIDFFPEKDLLFGNASANKKELDKTRALVIDRIFKDEFSTIIFTASSLMEKFVSKEQMLHNELLLEKGKEVDFNKIINVLAELNYERVLEVDNCGEFAVRGGIIDIFLYNQENPIRIDFFGDEITSIKKFNIETKRSFEEIEKISILPVLNNNDQNCSVLSYFNCKNTIVFIDEEKEILDRFELVDNMMEENRERRILANLSNEIFQTEIYSAKEIKSMLMSFCRVGLNAFDNISKENRLAFSNENIFGNNVGDIYFSNTNTASFNKHSYEDIIKTLKNYQEKGFTGIIVINSHTKAKRLEDSLNEYGIKTYVSEDKNEKVLNNKIAIFNGILSKGFVYELEDLSYFVFSENDIFDINVERKKRAISFKEDEHYKKIESLNNLKLGDYVVHETYGVGVYKGTKVLTSKNVSIEYVSIEYEGGGLLYIPCNNLETIMKYQSADGKKPHLNRLNSSEWQRTKTRVKKEIEEMAKDLIELYAKRYQSQGFQFSNDNIWQQEFEETFPYEETLDQIKAIELTKLDMQSSKCMDRLICGDVGFGKTEIAIRASFKAVQDSKQVCYLAPTTILCQQHYNTFKDRMSQYPITIDYLSRFKTKKEITQTLEKLKKGEIDIIIGTHRLLSKDVEYKDLGLLIIDEEQRFGVGHKEKIKKIKNNIDVLTLSATPIPRTLHMSLSGIRDLSLLTEAPPERVPIQTYVLEYNEELIREAINRELKRNGQVFFVHNKVSDIFNVAKKIQIINPDAQIAVAHGKMSEKELESVMSDFIKGKINVLISTTIIETGLDIPNANTIIVDDSEKFGMSQLYQLRGRIGRSDREGYAFFMYRKHLELTNEQEKRLKAIKEFSSLGSGIKIAMKDLEIRGAGNVLGISQSGHIDAIGYELYFKMLRKAMKYIKADDEIEKKQSEFDVWIKVDIDAFIPKYYIESEEEKLSMYRKISLCETQNDIKEVEEELIDRFGNIPIEVKNLLYIASLKIKAKACFITEIKVKEALFSLAFFPKAEINVEAIPQLIKEYQGALTFVNSSSPMLLFRGTASFYPNIEETLKVCEKIMDKIKI